MLIGELSQRSELPKDTIRFYEKKGLIQVKKSNSDFNNYKNYSEHNLERLQLIKRAKTFGFTLKEIDGFLKLVDSEKANCGILKKNLISKVKQIDQKITELKSLKNFIEEQMSSSASTCSQSTSSGNCVRVSK